MAVTEERMTTAAEPAPAGFDPWGPREQARRQWLYVAVGLVALVSVLGAITACFALAGSGSGGTATVSRKPVATAAGMKMASPSGNAAAPTLAQAKGVPFEKFHWVDPT